MAILSDIKSALERMDAALFQQMGDELLTTIYKPINIESRGTKEGQVKTVKGSPDTVFTMSDGKVLIEYTTQSNRPKDQFVAKLKSDIDSCINIKKTRIPIDEIKEIVLVSNQRIAIDIQDNLRTYLWEQYPDIKLTIFSIDDIATKLRQVPRILQEYLGIVTFPNLVEIDSFIKRFSSTKFSYLTPINNPYFEIDAQPISKGLELLKANDFLIISGEPGMGKTRYAIEIAKAFSDMTEAEAFVIEEKNRNIRETLDNIDKNVSYLFIIDDANRTAIWDEAIEYYGHTLNNNVKFIATVRSYALDSVITKCSNFVKVEQIAMSESPENLASKILTSFGITNTLWHKRINNITGKNIRLAVMCAQIALAGKKYNDLINVEGVYDAYYKPFFERLISDCTDCKLIKVVAVISFYKVVDLEETSLLDQIEHVFGLESSEFKSICRKLDDLECISITNDNIATIEDQNFGTYAFYKCFYVLKELSLSNLIEKLHNRRERLRDSIFSVWNCFHKKEVIDFSRSSISDAWKNLSVSIKEEREKCEFLEVFSGAIPALTFLYINNLIKENKFDDFSHSYVSSDIILSILSNFSHSEESDTTTALALIVEFLKSHPNKMESAVKIISEHWIYDDIDYANSYKRETNIVETLIDLSQESETGFILASRVLPSFLKFSYRYSRTKGRNFVIGRNAVIITKELNENRKRIWEWINGNITKFNQALFLRDLYVDFYEVKSIAKKLIKAEFDFINDCVSKLNITEDFNVCRNLASLSQRIKAILGKDILHIDWSKANRHYLLDCQISKDKNRRSSREWDIERKNIGKLAKAKSLQEIKCLVNDLINIAALKNISNDFRISYVIESTFELSQENGFKLWQYCIDQEFNFIPSRIISTYYSKGYDLSELVKFIGSQRLNLKSDLLLAFIVIIDNASSLISEHDFSKAIRHHSLEWFTIDGLCKRYYTDEKFDKGCRSVMAALISRVRSARSITGSEEFLLNFCIQYQSKIKLVEYIYINAINNTTNSKDRFDHDHKLLKYLLEKSPQLWVKCCKAIPMFVERHDISPYEFIWDIESYPIIIESTLQHYGSKAWIPYDEKENLFSFFCNLKGNTAANFMDDMIKKYCNNSNITSIIFEIVATHMGSSRTRHYVTFITNNTNIADFKGLDLFSHSMYGGDSFAPAIKSRIEFVDTLISEIRNLKNKITYIEHIQYLTERKGTLEREYTFELKRGHKHRLYDL